MKDKKFKQSYVTAEYSDTRNGAGRARRRLYRKITSHNICKVNGFSGIPNLAKKSANSYDELLQDLICDLNPIGAVEMTLIEKLASIIWRHQRILAAETAEIRDAAIRNTLDVVTTTHTDAWDLVRGAESGGILRNQSNPVLMRHAINILKDCRTYLAKNGLEGKGNYRWLQQLYGLAQDKFVPRGMFDFYVRFSEAIRDKDPELDPDESKESMLKTFDKEIKELELLVQINVHLQLERTELAQRSAMVPAAFKRLSDYEAHLSLEFDRTLQQFERVRRMRAGDWDRRFRGR